MNEKPIEIAIKLANNDKRTIKAVHVDYGKIYFLFDNGYWELAVIDNTMPGQTGDN